MPELAKCPWVFATLEPLDPSQADVERLARYFAQRYGGDDSLLEARKALDPEALSWRAGTVQHLTMRFSSDGQYLLNTINKNIFHLIRLSDM